MVEAITTKTIANVKANPAAESSASKSASGQGNSALKADALNSQPLNPRLRFDRLAGVVVTEFLSQSGAVQLQTPSNAVLAYLKVGLNADGKSKYQPTEEKPELDVAQENTFDS
jgi:hypothetical protein